MSTPAAEHDRDATDGRPWEKARPDTDTPAVWVHPGRYSGEPCIEGHRLPTRLVADLIFEGHDEGEAERSWLISRDEVMVECWFEARYGKSRAMRKAWKAWLDEFEGVLWHSTPSRWSEVPFPPSRGRG